MIHLIIEEDPLHPKSLEIEKWLNKYSVVYPDLKITRIFVTNNSRYRRLIAFINELQTFCNERLFAYIHCLKEIVHLEGSLLTNDLLDDIAFEVNCCRHFTNLDFPIIEKNVDGYLNQIKIDGQLSQNIDSFATINHILEKNLLKKTVPLNSIFLEQLFAKRYRLTWEELLFLYDDKASHEELKKLVISLLKKSNLKMQNINNTVLLKMPITSQCCEGEGCSEFNYPLL